VPRAGLAALLAAVAVSWPGGPAQADPSSRISGQVRVAGEPSSGWSVALRAGSPEGSVELDTSTTGGNGNFAVRSRGVRPDAILYVVASRGEQDRMLAVLGPAHEVPSRIVVNERTTVASIWAAARFLEGASIQGNRVGLLSAARNVPNLVDLETGEPGDVIQNASNGARTTTLATLNSLASLLADCLVGSCPRFFRLATPPGAPTASNTLQALHYVALNPWHNVLEIFEQRPPATDGGDDNPVFLPTLLWPPTAWTLSLVYTEGGFSAPGGMQLDAEGRVWTNNNFIPGSQSALLDIGGMPQPAELAYEGTGVTQLGSNGRPLSPRTGFLGGGTFGAAFGIAIDQRRHVWIGNFGGDSLSELRPDGSPVSPDSSSPYASDGGHRNAHFDDPQSLIVTADRSVWATNIAGNSVSQLIGGNPRRVRTWGLAGNCPDASQQFASPWGLASDHRGRVWVTNSANNSVSVIDPASATPCPQANHPLGTRDPAAAPWTVAIDMQGNVWATQIARRTITLLEASSGFREPRVFDADRTTVGPWGVAIDGANNVWISDFIGSRILNLCGTSGNCPEGAQSPGDRISPPGDPRSGEPGRGGGYGANGALQHLTAINIDQAGNVWVANNFDVNPVCLAGAGIPAPGRTSTVPEERLQPTCSGNGVVQILGIAAPVDAPLIGPARVPR
jgi:streptogramin lyase